MGDSPESVELLSSAHIYPHLFYPTPLHYTRLTTIYSRWGLYANYQKYVQRLNNFFSSSKSKTLISCYSLAIPGGKNYPFFAAKLTPTPNLQTIPSVLLKLKVGMPIRLTKDIGRLVNLPKGSRLVISSIEDESIGAELISPTRPQSDIAIPRVLVHCYNPNFPLLSFVRYQFPIQPCYASLSPWAAIDGLRFCSIFKGSQQSVWFNSNHSHSHS